MPHPTSGGFTGTLRQIFACNFQNIFEIFSSPETSRKLTLQQPNWTFPLPTSFCASLSSYCVSTLLPSAHPQQSHRFGENMAWMSSGSTNAALIKNLTSNGVITSERVKNAMLAVRPQPRPNTTPKPSTISSFQLALTMTRKLQ